MNQKPIKQICSHEHSIKSETSEKKVYRKTKKVGKKNQKQKTNRGARERGGGGEGERDREKQRCELIIIRIIRRRIVRRNRLTDWIRRNKTTVKIGEFNY